MQFDQDERGFSFSKEGPLDMRMDPTAKMTAKEVVNTLPEKDLGEMFKELGEEKLWRVSAKAIVNARRKKPIQTTTELSQILEEVIPRGGRKIHPATKIFQAIRIYVNRELETLQETIEKAVNFLRPGGQVAVITFHSLEDRIVKNVFRDLSSPIRNHYGQKISEAKLETITKKPIMPTFKETRNNRRARSAKFRVARKRVE